MKAELGSDKLYKIRIKFNFNSLKTVSSADNHVLHSANILVGLIEVNQYTINMYASQERDLRAQCVRISAWMMTTITVSVHLFRAHEFLIGIISI